MHKVKLISILVWSICIKVFGQTDTSFEANEFVSIMSKSMKNDSTLILHSQYRISVLDSSEKELYQNDFNSEILLYNNFCKSTIDDVSVQFNSDNILLTVLPKQKMILVDTQKTNNYSNFNLQSFITIIKSKNVKISKMSAIQGRPELNVYSINIPQWNNGDFIIQLNKYTGIIYYAKIKVKQYGANFETNYQVMEMTIPSVEKKAFIKDDFDFSEYVYLDKEKNVKVSDKYKQFKLIDHRVTRTFESK